MHYAGLASSAGAPLPSWAASTAAVLHVSRLAASVYATNGSTSCSLRRGQHARQLRGTQSGQPCGLHQGSFTWRPAARAQCRRQAPPEGSQSAPGRTCIRGTRYPQNRVHMCWTQDTLCTEVNQLLPSLTVAAWHSPASTWPLPAAAVPPPGRQKGWPAASVCCAAMPGCDRPPPCQRHLHGQRRAQPAV